MNTNIYSMVDFNIRKRIEAEKIKEIDESRLKTTVSLRVIYNDVVEVFQVEFKKSGHRYGNERIVMVRKLFCFVAKIKSIYSVANIALFIGYSEHSTVCHNIKNVYGYFEVKDKKFIGYWNRYLSNSKLFSESDFNSGNEIKTKV